MKKLVLTLSITALMSGFANATTVTPERSLAFKGDLNYASFCEAAVMDDVNLMRRSINSKIGVVSNSKRTTIKTLLDENNLSCNGMGIIDFSLQRNAVNVVSFLEETAEKL